MDHGRDRANSSLYDHEAFGGYPIASIRLTCQSACRFTHVASSFAAYEMNILEDDA